MKKPVLILSLLFWWISTGWTFAQWSQNPGQPLPVSSYNSGTHTSPTVFPDGTGGLFVFWGDSRGGNINSNPWLYVQHFNSAGERLLPDTGKLVIGGTGGTKTGAYGIASDPQGNFWISWATGTSSFADSILLNKFNRNSFQAIWPKAKTLARRNNLTLNIISISQTNLVASGDSLMMTYQGTWMGGSDYLKAMKINANGLSSTASYGLSLDGMGYGPYNLVPVADGLIVVKRGGNGAGAGAYATKLNFAGAKVWGPVTLTTGTAGLGYDFKAIPDGQGGFVLVFVESGNDLLATRWDGNGNPVWNPVQKPVCEFNSSQDSPDVVLSQGSVYVVWRDNRPPASNTDIYMQKLNLNGDRLWNPNGRIVFRLNSYIPVPKLMEDSDHNLIVTSYQSSVGFVGQKVRPDSTLAWPGIGRIIASQSSNQCPFYEQYTLTSGPGGVAFPVWVGSGTQRLYISSIDSSGQFTATAPVWNEEEPGLVYPNPATDEIHLQPSDGTKELEWQLLDLNGRVRLRQKETASGLIRISIQGLAKGVYLLQWNEGDRWRQKKILKS